MSDTRLLVVGAGSAGRMAVAEMRARPGSGYLPLAFIDDDPAKQGTTVDGLPVLGGRADIPAALRRVQADEILIALPSVHGEIIRDIVKTCRTERVSFRVVPGIWEIIRGDVHMEQIRRFEPEDLLGRESVEQDPSLLEPVYRGRRILVTGAGGSIGRELARQAAGFGPASLVLLGRGENSLFETEVELSRIVPAPPVDLALVDVRDRAALGRAFARHRPEVVLHAAAHKHVTFMERYPEEAVLNNVVATLDLVRAAEESGAGRFVMLSTDKAVNPRSVMGASKRLAELLLAERTTEGSATRFMAVRFGNVLGSRGSVVPLFLRQIETGGPVTVSDPEVTRYFMTVKEAAMLVLKAGAVGEGGEIFILDMGDQIRIADLARDLIILSGRRPEVDIALVTTGLKPGEKLHEELVHDFEELVATGVAKLLLARRRSGANPRPAARVAALEALARRGDRDAIRAAVLELIPEARLEGATESRSVRTP